MPSTSSIRDAGHNPKAGRTTRVKNFSAAENLIFVRALYLRLPDIWAYVSGRTKEVQDVAKYVHTQLPHRSEATIKSKMSKLLNPMKKNKQSLMSLPFFKTAYLQALSGIKSLNKDNKYCLNDLEMEDPYQSFSELGKRKDTVQQRPLAQVLFSKKSKTLSFERVACNELVASDSESTKESLSIIGKGFLAPPFGSLASRKDLGRLLSDREFNEKRLLFAAQRESSLDTEVLVANLDRAYSEGLYSTDTSSCHLLDLDGNDVGNHDSNGSEDPFGENFS